MSFDEVCLPLCLGYGAEGGVRFQTEIVTLESGFEKRNQKWGQARRKFDARTGVVSVNDASLLVAFFQARAGRARGFRVRDWNDYSSALDGKSVPLWEDQLIGTGDGVTVSFQLVKNYGEGDVFYRRVVRKPVEGSVCVGVDDTEYEIEWSVDNAKGLVTFAQAPAVGALVKAGFYFDVPVRFDTDCLNIFSKDKNLSKAEIPLIEVRV